LSLTTAEHVLHQAGEMKQMKKCKRRLIAITTLLIDGICAAAMPAPDSRASVEVAMASELASSTELPAPRRPSGRSQGSRR